MVCPIAVLRVLSLLLVLGPALLVGQHGAADPQPVTQRFLVRDAESGNVMPGVAIRLTSEVREEPHVIDGWLRRFGRRPGATRLLRSDPDGRITFVGSLLRQPIGLAAGFRLVEERQEQELCVLLVQRCEHRAVQVVDAAGKVVPGFGVTRQGTGEIVLTDDFGIARFALLGPLPTAGEDGFVPSHWLGPQPAPSCRAVGAAPGLLRMKLPACGTLRLRFLRRGAPAMVTIDAAWLSAPVEQSLWSFRPEALPPQAEAMLRSLEPVSCRGIEVGPIAWSGELRGEVMIGRLRLPFVAATSPSTGAVLELDLETDPPRPRLQGVVRAGGGPAPAPARVRVGAVTDAGVYEDEVDLGPNGELLTGFDTRFLTGTVLRRVWVDGLDAAAGTAASFDRELPLHAGKIELGELLLAPHPPALRGRVVDVRGEPLPGVQVAVHGPGPDGRTIRAPVPVDRDGRFVLAGPRFRDANGELATAVATATLARRWREEQLPEAARFRSLASAGTAPGGEVELVVPDLDIGTFALVVRGAQNPWLGQLQARLVDGDDHTGLHERQMEVGDGGAWQRGSLAAPLGRFRLQLSSFNHLLYEQYVVIQPVRPDAPNAVQEHTVDFPAIVRPRAIVAVDEAGRALPDARVHLRTAGHRSGIMPDEFGQLAWLEPLQLPHAAYLLAKGKQILQLPATASGNVTMVPDVPLYLRLQIGGGEPLDGEWIVMLDPDDENGMVVQGQVREGAARCMGPWPGRYDLALMVRHEQYERRVRVGAIEVDANRSVPDGIAIDAAALASLRALQQEPAPKK